MRNKEYWIARAIQRENEAYLRGVGLTAKMFQEYDAAAKAIRKEIGDFYGKYAGKYGLTYEQAVRLLTRKEFREWKATLAEYVARIAREPDPRVKALLTAQLDALSTNSRISRLEALLGQIDLKLNDLFDQGVAQMKAEFGDAFREGYYKKVFDIQSRAGFMAEIAKLDEAVVEDVLSYPWSGAMFSDRLYDNYASQEGKGTHFGLDRLKYFMQKYYRQNGPAGWVLKCDITKYFYRINHDVLKSQLRRLIHDPDVLWLLDMIIDSTEGPGIPIGNHTSQWFAVLYLSGMDHMIKERLGIKFYGRYMDDFYLIHQDKDYLIYCLEEIKKYLVPLGLELNHKTAIFPLSQGIDFLGFRTYMTDSGKVVRKIRRDSKNRIRRKLKKFRHLLDEGRITFDTVVQSYSSWTGHAGHGNSHHLIRQTDELFFDLFKKELEEYHVKTNVDVTRWRDREVGQHEV